MRDSRKRLLQLVYDYDQTNGGPVQISADGSDSDCDSYTLQSDVYYLIRNGYLIEPYSLARTFVLTLTEKGEKFVENGFQEVASIPNTSTKNIFNIENASNSIIGTQSSANLNINTTLQEARERINSSNSDDKEDLQQIIDLLEQIVNNQIPVERGLLAKFGTSIQKNSWITGPIASILLNWLM